MTTLIVYDVFLIAFALLVCLGSLNLGFGTFSQPAAGFVPFLSGLLLGMLSLIDLISGVFTHWEADKKDAEIWSDIHWRKLLSTLAILVLYIGLLPKLGFSIATTLLLLFLFRLMEPRPWWLVIVLSVVITGIFYLGFEIALNAQLPRGFLGF